jgi:hypothetical protein
MAKVQTSVSALHQLRALILAAEQVNLLRLRARTELGAFDEQVANPTVAFELEVYRARLTRSRMTSLVARMTAADRTIKTTRSFTFLAVYTGGSVVQGMSDPVAFPLTGMVSAGKLTTAFPTA